MLVLFAALSLGSPVNLFDIPQTSCRLLTLVPRQSGVTQECCNSCSDGYLLHNTWLIDRVETTDVENTFDRESEEVVAQGSGGTRSQWQLHADSIAATYMTERHAACGACVTPDQCMQDLKGTINTWHRLCITRA